MSVWANTYEELSAAAREGPVEPQDLVRLSVAALLTGHDAESVDALARAHHEFANRGDVEHAARSAFSLGFQLSSTGRAVQAGGWFSRARRLVDEHQLDSVVRGYLLLATARGCFEAGDAVAAHTAFSDAVAIGQRFADADLIAFARHGQGRALLRMGRIGEGVALLDEVMVGTMATKVAPVTIGAVYCSVVDACHEIFDLRRAQEWTAALTSWCASQPDRVPFRGHCLVHRAEILQLHGAWVDAMGEVENACARLSDPPGQMAVGSAYYQRGELHRLRGAFAEAEVAYREASQNGHKPQPGLALLRLASDKVAAAVASITRAVDEMRGNRRHPLVLSAAAEILLANRDVPAARAAAEELEQLAARLDAPYLRAHSAHAMGAVLLAEREAESALASLQQAWSLWRDVEAPYDAARTRVLLGLANRALGDDDAAAFELDAAAAVFQRLGARPDLDRLERLSRQPGSPKGAAGLTARELEVLGLIATGKTNRVIADRLGISEKTVARHVSNVFLKLNLSSRAAATAYAYEHDLRPPPST